MLPHAGCRCREIFKNNKVFLSQYPQGLGATIFFVTVGLASLGWLMLRSGRRPDRLRYPCQQLAGANSLIFVAWLGGLIGLHKWFGKIKTGGWKKYAVLSGLAILVGGGWQYALAGKVWPAAAYNANTPVCPGGNCTNWLSPKVVSVREENAVNGTSPGNDYAADSRVNQAVVNGMVSRGIQTLAGKTTDNEAWGQLFINKFGHDYRSGEKIGIKLNWNNSHPSYGGPGLFNPLPQTAAALISSLTAHGIPQENIYLYDCTEVRKFYKYFMDNLWDKGWQKIHYVAFGAESSHGIMAETPTAGSLVSPEIDNDTYWCGQVQNNFNYLINVPLLRAHGGDNQGFSLGFKNHFGSVINTSSLDHFGTFQKEVRLINATGAIKDKQVLVMGDGLYAANQNNTSPPTNIYKTLFFAQDPVAADSVMLDHLLTFQTRGINDSQMQYLDESARISGLGVYEHWNNATAKQYSKINYVMCNPTCPGVTPAATATIQPTATKIPTATLTPTSRPGDANNDGLVNGKDYNAWLQNYGTTTSGGAARGDFNADGVVNGADYGVWLLNYS